LQYEDAEKERIAAAKLARSQELQRRAQVRLAQHREQLKADKEAQVKANDEGRLSPWLLLTRPVADQA
jgi:hypothetical protein